MVIGAQHPIGWTRYMVIASGIPSDTEKSTGLPWLIAIDVKGAEDPASLGVGKPCTAFNWQIMEQLWEKGKPPAPEWGLEERVR